MGPLFTFEWRGFFFFGDWQQDPSQLVEDGIALVNAHLVIFAAILMARILGIDFGTRRTGIAVTDPLKIIVSPLTTLKTEEVIDFLKGYMEAEKVESLVCGLPGSENTDTRRALEKFVEQLKVNFPHLPIAFQDEDLTSRKASEVILRSGLKKMKRRDKALVDKISAVLILQEYLGHLNDVHTI